MNDELPYCPRCPHPTEDQDIREVIAQVIRALPEEIKCGPELYRSRLEACATCPGQAQGLCRYCGCYVEVRAAKKPMGCPNPAGSLWPLLEE